MKRSNLFISFVAFVLCFNVVEAMQVAVEAAEAAAPYVEKIATNPSAAIEEGKAVLAAAGYVVTGAAAGVLARAASLQLPSVDGKEIVQQSGIFGTGVDGSHQLALPTGIGFAPDTSNGLIGTGANVLSQDSPAANTRAKTRAKAEVAAGAAPIVGATQQGGAAVVKATAGAGVQAATGIAASGAGDAVCGVNLLPDTIQSVTMVPVYTSKPTDVNRIGFRISQSQSSYDPCYKPNKTLLRSPPNVFSDMIDMEYAARGNPGQTKFEYASKQWKYYGYPGFIVYMRVSFTNEWINFVKNVFPALCGNRHEWENIRDVLIVFDGDKTYGTKLRVSKANTYALAEFMKVERKAIQDYETKVQIAKDAANALRVAQAQKVAADLAAKIEAEQRKKENEARIAKELADQKDKLLTSKATCEKLIEETVQALQTFRNNPDAADLKDASPGERRTKIAGKVRQLEGNINRLWRDLARINNSLKTKHDIDSATTTLRFTSDAFGVMGASYKQDFVAYFSEILRIPREMILDKKWQNGELSIEVDSQVIKVGGGQDAFLQQTANCLKIVSQIASVEQKKEFNWRCELLPQDGVIDAVQEQDVAGVSSSVVLTGVTICHSAQQRGKKERAKTTRMADAKKTQSVIKGKKKHAAPGSSTTAASLSDADFAEIEQKKDTAGAAAPAAPAVTGGAPDPNKPPKDDEDEDEFDEAEIEKLSKEPQRRKNFDRQSQNELNRSNRTIERLIKEHLKKLKDYRENPDACDNLDFLKKAPTQQIREKIIQERIAELIRQITRQKVDLRIVNDLLQNKFGVTSAPAVVLGAATQTQHLQAQRAATKEATAKLAKVAADTEVKFAQAAEKAKKEGKPFATGLKRRARVEQQIRKAKTSPEGVRKRNGLTAAGTVAPRHQVAAATKKEVQTKYAAVAPTGAYAAHLKDVRSRQTAAPARRLQPHKKGAAVKPGTQPKVAPGKQAKAVPAKKIAVVSTRAKAMRAAADLQDKAALAPATASSPEAVIQQTEKATILPAKNIPALPQSHSAARPIMPTSVSSAAGGTWRHSFSPQEYGQALRAYNRIDQITRNPWVRAAGANIRTPEDVTNIFKAIYVIGKGIVVNIKDIPDGFRYWFSTLKESVPQERSLSYNDAYAERINAAAENINTYRQASTWKVVNHTVAALQARVAELNERYVEEWQKSTYVLGLLRLIPEHDQSIRAAAVGYSLDRQVNARTKEELLEHTRRSSAAVVCHLRDQRIALARAAKTAFDREDFNEAMAQVQRVVDMYNEERRHWQYWFASHNTLANTEQREEKQFACKVDLPAQINRTNFTRCLGTPFNHLIHEELLERVNRVAQLFNKMVKNPFQINENLIIKNGIALLYAFLEAASKYNQVNDIFMARAMRDFVDALLAVQAATANIHYEKTSQTGDVFGAGFYHVFHLFSSEKFDYEQHFRKRWAEAIQAATTEQKESVITAIKNAKNKLKAALRLSGMNRETFAQDILKSVPNIKNNVKTEEAQGSREVFGFVIKQLFSPHYSAAEAETITTSVTQLVVTEIASSQALTEATSTNKQAIKAMTSIFDGALREVYAEIKRKKTMADRKHQAPVRQSERLKKAQEVAEASQAEEQLQEESESEEASQDQDEETTDASDAASSAGEAEPVQPNINVGVLSRPLQIYEALIHGAVPTDLHVAHVMVTACDIANRYWAFESVPLPECLIEQLPCLSQLYPALQALSGYEDRPNRQCGYYALHNAVLLAAHPQATNEELIELLNDRGAFECDTLIPCRAVVDAWRQAGDEHGTVDLLGNEIEALLPRPVRPRIIVLGADADNPAVNIANVARAEAKIRAFKAGHINQLTWIISASDADHWIVAQAKRRADGTLVMTLADSLGIDQSQNVDVLDIVHTLTT